LLLKRSKFYVFENYFLKKRSCATVTAVSGWAYLSFVSNISCLVELADILHFHNCNKRNSRLAVVLKRSCNFHIRKNIGKRLSA